MGIFVIGAFVIIVTSVSLLTPPTSSKATRRRWRSCRHLGIVQMVLFYFFQPMDIFIFLLLLVLVIALK